MVSNGIGKCIRNLKNNNGVLKVIKKSFRINYLDIYGKLLEKKFVNGDKIKIMNK